MNDAAACVYTFFLSGAITLLRPKPPRFEVSRSHTHIHSRTPLNEWSARRRGHYPHINHKRRTRMPSAEFNPAVIAMKRLHAYSVDSISTGIDTCIPTCGWAYYWPRTPNSTPNGICHSVFVKYKYGLYTTNGCVVLCIVIRPRFKNMRAIHGAFFLDTCTCPKTAVTRIANCPSVTVTHVVLWLGVRGLATVEIINK